jgi:hypothetical protein
VEIGKSGEVLGLEVVGSGVFIHRTSIQN